MLWCTVNQKGTGTGFSFSPANGNRLQHLNSSYNQSNTSDTLAVTALKVPGSTLSDTKNCSCSGRCPVPQGAPPLAGLSDRRLCFCWNLVKSGSWGCFCPWEGMSSLQLSLPEPAGLTGQGAAQKPAADIESSDRSWCPVPFHASRPFQDVGVTVSA